MERGVKGCGCAVAVLMVVLGAASYLGYKYVLPWWKTKPPPASGGELRVHVLDVGPVNGDSILIVSPAGKAVLIDAGDNGKGKNVLEALKRLNIQQLDYFIGTHPHPDHLGGADEVLKGIKVLNVIDSGQSPEVPESLASSAKPAKPGDKAPAKKPAKRLDPAGAITKFYDEYKEAITQSGAHYEQSVAGTKYDLGGGARLTILAPTEPLFERDKMMTGGNVPNANSVVARLDYGDFSMLLPGDAEEQTEHRLISKDSIARNVILKVSHHGSKYATSQEMLDRVKPAVAIFSCGEWNRYGHPSQVVLDRLKAVNAKVYRTDIQGEITITTKGRENDFVIKTSKEAKSDVWIGRAPQKDDATRSGFIAYGDFGPPPKTKQK